MHKKEEFMIMTPAKAVALLLIETPATPRFVFETASAQGMTMSSRCYSP